MTKARGKEGRDQVCKKNEEEQATVQKKARPSENKLEEKKEQEKKENEIVKQEAD